ncbi:transposase [Psychrobacter sp. 72-O-c]|uniref:transposase n=1 Tax=Psychrobacter sp. 72-O-c TaxID=2774125 RepID=UPI0019185EE7
MSNKLRKNIKGQHLETVNEALLNRRLLVGTVLNKLQNLCQSEHYRQQSVNWFMANSLSALTACCWCTYKLLVFFMN